MKNNFLFLMKCYISANDSTALQCFGKDRMMKKQWELYNERDKGISSLEHRSLWSDICLVGEHNRVGGDSTTFGTSIQETSLLTNLEQSGREGSHYCR